MRTNCLGPHHCPWAVGLPRYVGVTYGGRLIRGMRRPMRKHILAGSWALGQCTPVTNPTCWMKVSPSVVGLNTVRLFIIRPPARSNGMTYKMLVMFFFFFSTPNLRAPSANHRETSPHDRCLCLFYKLTTKIRGALPPTKLGAENMQNFGRFHTTSDFDREYLPNGLRYPKSEN